MKNEESMTLFTPGPVKLASDILEISQVQEPYFRTDQFSKTILDAIDTFHSVLGLPKNFSIFFIPGSGTTAMECASQFVAPGQTLISVETGIFGERFSEIIERRKTIVLKRIRHDIHSPNFTFDDLSPDQNIHFTLTETSTGYRLKDEELPDARLRDGLVLVDAVTALFTQEVDLQKFDVIYTASQKGLACSPGLGIVICSPKAKEKLMSFKPTTLSMDPRIYLDNIARGQTPYTPPINILFQIHRQIKKIGDPKGYSDLIEVVRNRAYNFRTFLKSVQAELLIPDQANCITNFRIPGQSSIDLLRELEVRGIQIAPNSPNCFPDYVRVAHFGEQKVRDYELLQNVLREVSNN